MSAANEESVNGVLERARRHLRQLAPHMRERESAQILAELVKELQWERGRAIEAAKEIMSLRKQIMSLRKRGILKRARVQGPA